MMTRASRSIALALLVASASGAVEALAQPAYEAQPVLKASALAPPSLLAGPRFKVDERVPTTDFLARFTIRSDFGVVEAHGREMLAVRVAEVAALEQLAGMSKTEEFLKAAGNAAARPAKAAAFIVMNPVETAKGAPAAAGRFFDRMALGAKRISGAASEPGKSSEEKTAEVTRRVGAISVDVLGYEQERRALAKRLGIDPYTTNPVLAAKLDELAWVTFSGRLGVGTLTAVVVPFSSVLTATSVVNDLVWDTPPADLVKLNETKLVALGAAPEHVQALLQNPWFSLTVLTALVTGLEQLGGVAGRDEVVVFAARATSEDQARLIAGAAQMLVRSHATDPLARISAPGPLVGWSRGGRVIVPAPVDYVVWTARAAGFASRRDLSGPDRALWITGSLSPRARQGLAAAGWKVREDTGQR